MKETWKAAQIELSAVMSQKTAGRFTDLLLLTTLAIKKGCLSRKARTVSVQALLEGTHVFACTAHKEKLDRAVSGRVIDLLKTLPDPWENPRKFDEWFFARQSIDPTQKSRGAYVTPFAFAEGIAHRTLVAFDGTKIPHVIDPSVGTGAFLLAAFNFMRRTWPKRNAVDLVRHLHGVDIDAGSRELCCGLLWIASGGKASLDSIAKNVVVENALTHDWWSQDLPRFDALLMNPPWDSLRHQASHSVLEKHRQQSLERVANPTVGAEGLPPLFTLQGKGDRNLFKLFLELAPHLVREGGRFGALIPGAFASDNGMAPLRSFYLDRCAIEQWTLFENIKKHFPIDGRYKFGALIGTRDYRGTSLFSIRSFSTCPPHLDSQHLSISPDDLVRLGGRSKMFPEVVDEVELQTLLRMKERGMAFFENGPVGKVVYRRELDLTLDKEQFSRFEDVYPKASDRVCLSNREGARYVPVVEGRMVGRYDFFEKSWREGKGRTAIWERNVEGPNALCQPQYVAYPRLPDKPRVAICDVTSATNTRTMLAALVPDEWPCGNTAPVLIFQSLPLALAGAAILNSMVFDWMVRRVVSGLHLNKFYLEELAWPSLSEGDQAILANCAAALTASRRMPNVTFSDARGLLRPATLTRNEELAAHVTIEKIVACGFGLTSEMLTRVLSPNRMDRRGFWRWFESDSLSLEVARILLQDGEPRKRRREAA